MNDSRQFTDLSSLSNVFPLVNRAVTIVHVNIRSIKKYWDEFQVVIRNIKHIVDVFVLTEINIHDTYKELYSLCGYRSFFSTRDSSRGGGIAIYVKERWSCAELKFSFNHAEYLSIKMCDSQISTLVLAFYRPPSSNVKSFLDELDANIANIGQSEIICLVADFNIDILKSTRSNVCDYLTLLSNHGISPIINVPTREEFTKGKLVFSCLDHIDIRSSGASVKSAVISQKLADHYFVACQIDCGIVSGENKKPSNQIANIDSHVFDKLISSYDWEQLVTTANCQTAYTKLVDAFAHFTEKSIKVIKTKK